MSDPIMAAPRDASVWARPNTRSKKVAHVAINVESVGSTFYEGEEFHGEAACDPSRVVLDMNMRSPAEDMPEDARCRRRGCASRWPAYRPRIGQASLATGSQFGNDVADPSFAPCEMIMRPPVATGGLTSHTDRET